MNLELRRADTVQVGEYVQVDRGEFAPVRGRAKYGSAPDDGVILSVQCCGMESQTEIYRASGAVILVGTVPT